MDKGVILKEGLASNVYRRPMVSVDLDVAALYGEKAASDPQLVEIIKAWPYLSRWTQLKILAKAIVYSVRGAQ